MKGRKEIKKIIIINLKGILNAEIPSFAKEWFILCKCYDKYKSKWRNYILKPYPLPLAPRCRQNRCSLYSRLREFQQRLSNVHELQNQAVNVSKEKGKENVRTRFQNSKGTANTCFVPEPQHNISTFDNSYITSMLWTVVTHGICTSSHIGDALFFTV